MYRHVCQTQCWLASLTDAGFADRVTGAASDESIKLCYDTIDTLQELLDDLRGVGNVHKEVKKTPGRRKVSTK
jgi:hypothetical protein